VPLPPPGEELKEKHSKIFYGDTGYTYEALFGDYLRGGKVVDIEDPYIRIQHQIANFVRFCELVVKIGSAHTINLTTGFDDELQQKESDEKFLALASSLIAYGIKLNVTYNQHQHDREIRLDNGWKIKVGRGFDICQKPDSWFSIGANDLEMRPCLETIVDIFKDEES
jgi:ATP-dependent Lon protease